MYCVFRLREYLFSRFSFMFPAVLQGGARTHRARSSAAQPRSGEASRAGRYSDRSASPSSVYSSSGASTTTDVPFALARRRPRGRSDVSSPRAALHSQPDVGVAAPLAGEAVPSRNGRAFSPSPQRAEHRASLSPGFDNGSNSLAGPLSS